MRATKSSCTEAAPALSNAEVAARAVLPEVNTSSTSHMDKPFALLSP